MSKKYLKSFSSLFCVLAIILSFHGCSLNSYSVEELESFLPVAFENSLSEELYYWKETVNASDHTSWKTCNVYAEIDKKYEVIRDENGEFANMKIDVLEEFNKKNVFKALCGRSSGSDGDKNYLFENDFDDLGNAVNYRKSEMTPQEYVNSDSFKNKYTLDAMLKEFEYLTVDDMIFDIDDSLMEHRGKVIKFSFAVKPEYIERYKAETGKDSLFAGSKYATMEFAYDRFASIVIYAEEKLGSGISADKEIYKLETVYYGPIVNIPSYDNPEWQ